MFTEKQIETLSESNPGALFALKQINEFKEHVKRETIIQAILKAGLTGYRIFVLSQDICKNDLEKMAFYCFVAKPETLYEAAGKMDFSGNEILNNEVYELNKF